MPPDERSEALEVLNVGIGEPSVPSRRVLRRRALYRHTASHELQVK